MKVKGCLSLLVFVWFFSACVAAPQETAQYPTLAPIAIPEDTAVPEIVPATATPEPTPQEHLEDRALTIAWLREPESLNPYYARSWHTVALQQLYLCWPWEYDDQNRPYPHLVTEIPSIENGGVSADGLTITLNLRDDIVWSDGEPITSADFVFTYEMIVADSNAVYSRYPYDLLVSVDAPAPDAVVMRFSEPFAPWRANFWHGILPAHILQPVYDLDGSLNNAGWNLAPEVGCGPYLYDRWDGGESLHFRANRNYWLGAPKIDSLEFRFLPDPNVRTTALMAGEADISVFPPLSDLPALQEQGFVVFPIESGYVEGWFFNFREMANPWIRELALRQAIVSAIDRDAMINNLLFGLSKPANTLWDPLATSGYVSPGIVPWAYDPELSKSILDQNGYLDRDGDGLREDPNGGPLRLVLGATTKPLRQDVQAFAQRQLRQVGIDLQIENWPPEIFFDSFSNQGPLATGAVDIMQWSDKTYFPDPDLDYWLCSQLAGQANPWGINYFGCDEALDALFQAQIVETDPDKRSAIFQEITQSIHDKVYWFGLFHDPDMWIVNDDLSGVKFSGVTPFYNITEWDFLP